MSADDLCPLSLLASAMVGRPVEVSAAEAGDRTWTDGRTIYLEPVTDPRTRLRLLAVQASLLAAGSLEPDVVQALRGHRSLTRRYLAIEGQRALAANEAYLPPVLRSMADREVAHLAGSPQGSLELAGRAVRFEPGWELGTIEPRRIRGPEDDDADPGAFAARPASSTEAARLEVLGEDDAVGLDVGALLSSPVGGGSAVGRLLARLLRPARSRTEGGVPGTDAPTHLAWGRPGAGATVTSLPMRDAARAEVGDEATGARTYPEWDEHRQAHRPGWCLVLEEDATAGPSAAVALAAPAGLRRALAPLGTGRTPCRRRRQGDDLDIDAVVEARVDRRAGGHASEDVYVEHLRRRRDLSVLVLLDVSGSAAEPGVGGRAVHDHQREAAAALTTVLHHLGDRVALCAFSSSGRRAVRVRTVKAFTDELDGTTARRLAALQPGAYTRLGAAIRHGTWLLARHGGTPGRLLVVLSDGLAYDHGYEGRYGEADARHALVEARQQGVGCVCLSVGAAVDVEALRRVFGPAAHAALPTAAQLPATTGPLFAAALRSAEAQQRRHQRSERARVRRLVGGQP